jgi:uncharacterized damage-inducible protein DinB
MNHLDDLFQHMHWADATVWQCVLDSEQASADGQIVDLFYHLHSVQRAFLAVWTQSPIALPKRTHFVSTQQIADWGRTYHAELISVLGDLDMGQLPQSIHVPWSRFMEKQYGYTPGETSYEETMHHVLLHTAHHRGQILRRLRELEIEIPTVDYIVWLWQGRPAPSWS